MHCIHRSDNVATVPATKAAHTPVFLRSYKSVLPKQALIPKVTQALAELNITYGKLVMPTRENIQQLEALYEATSALLETKRAMDRVEHEIQACKTRLSDRGRMPQSDAGDGMDASPNRSTVADNEEVNASGRASSVAGSIRSVGGRKRVCRPVIRSFKAAYL